MGDRRLHGEPAQPVRVHQGRRLGRRPSAVHPDPALQRQPDEQRHAQVGALGKVEVADAQGHRYLHGDAVGVPDGVAPAGVRGRERGLDDGRLGSQLGQIAVEGLPGPGSQLVALGAGRLAGSVARTADPVARVGQGPVELLVHAGLGEVDGAAVGGDGAGQILEHAPDLVVEALVHRPAGGVARDRLGGLSGLGGGRGGRGRRGCGVLPSRVRVVDGAVGGGSRGGRARGGVRLGCGGRVGQRLGGPGAGGGVGGRWSAEPVACRTRSPPWVRGGGATERASPRVTAS